MIENTRRYWFVVILLASALAGSTVLAADGENPPAGAGAGKGDVSPTGPAADPLGFQREAWPLIERHCTSCHGPKKQKMGIDFTKMTDVPSIFGHRDVWRKAREALEAEDMPQDPEETGFTAADRKRLIAWIKDRVETIDRASPLYLDPGPPLVRQLTRAEFNNTVRDLLQIVQFDPARAGGIADDSEFVVERFTNLAAAQSLDETLLEKYLTAADATLAFFFDDAKTGNPKLKTARAALFFTRPGKGVSEHDAAAAVLGRFVRLAFRGPVDPTTFDKLMRIVDQALKSGDTFEQAIRKAMKPVLVAPEFLYRFENDSAASGTDAYPVSDDELAVRLSYFLWATMPDEELLKLAEAKQLSQPQVLEAQVKRMLADPKARALTDYFGAQWLQLNKLNRALPSPNVFPTFNNAMKDSMRQEALTFFDAIRTEDRSILDLLDADYTYVNEDLARLYGIPGVTGKKMQRVALRAENHRGGVLGMGAILAMTSHSDRTKPTTRGKWILEVVLGSPPPPPPANVSNFSPPKDKNAPIPKTFREKLAQHATDATCAACHKRIDPLGFALENYNAIGEWRDQVGNDPVDNAGRLPGGKEFHGVDGLKQVLHARQDQFVRNVASQMLTYALGRQLQYQDDLALADIVDALKRDGYCFSTLIRGVVTSRQFTHRRNPS